MHRIKSLALMGAALTLVAGCSGTGTGNDATANDTAATADLESLVQCCGIGDAAHDEGH